MPTSFRGNKTGGIAVVISCFLAFGIIFSSVKSNTIGKLKRFKSEQEKNEVVMENLNQHEIEGI